MYGVFMSYTLPRGTYDLLPPQSWYQRKVLDAFANMAATHGCGEVVTPVFESSQLFERSSGETSDVVSKEMYRFNDRKGREFALRPEGTAPVVRSFLQNLAENSGLTRLFYTGPMFRYDRPQKGRYRQFVQYGAEFFGSAHPSVDAEVIALAHDYLVSLGLPGITVELNSVGLPAPDGPYELALKAYYAPHHDELCPDCRARLEKNPRRLLDCKVETCRTIAKNAPLVLEYLDDDSRAHFDAVQFYLRELGVNYVLNPRIVRGLDYYTHTAFEICYSGLGAQSALLGGGRYDKLVAQLGGKPTPAIGFAGGVERLLAALEEQNCLPGPIPVPAVFMVSMGDKAFNAAYTAAAKLRALGLTVVYEPDKRSLGAQMKAAGKSGAAWAVIIGDGELEKGEWSLKNMLTGEQRNLSWEMLAEELAKKS